MSFLPFQAQFYQEKVSKLLAQGLSFEESGRLQDASEFLAREGSASDCLSLVTAQACRSGVALSVEDAASQI